MLPGDSNTTVENRLPERGSSWLISLSQSFGYKTNKEGTCYGVAGLGVFYILSKKLLAFDNHLMDLYKKFQEKQYVLQVLQIQSQNLNYIHELLATSPSMSSYLLAYQKKAYEEWCLQFYAYQNISLETEEIAFLDTMELIQQPHVYVEIIEVKNSLQSLESALNLLLPIELESLGGISKAASFCYLYTESQISNLLENIKKQAIDLPNFALLINGVTHTISLGYNAKKNEWQLIDAGADLTVFYSSDAKVIGHKIFTSLQYENQQAILGIEVFGLSAYKEKLANCFKLISAGIFNACNQPGLLNRLTPRLYLKWMWEAIFLGHAKVVAFLIVFDQKKNLNIFDRTAKEEMVTLVIKSHNHTIFNYLAKNPFIFNDINLVQSFIATMIEYRNDLALDALFNENQIQNIVLISQCIYRELRLAIDANDLDKLEFLLKCKGINLQTVLIDQHQNTLLHFAVFENLPIEVFDLLLQYSNAETVNKANQWGDVPLFLAINNNRKDMVEKLLSIKGINIDVVNGEGITIFQAAKKQPDIYKLYKSFLAKQKKQDYRLYRARETEEKTESPSKRVKRR